MIYAIWLPRIYRGEGPSSVSNNHGALNWLSKMLEDFKTLSQRLLWRTKFLCDIGHRAGMKYQAADELSKLPAVKPAEKHCKQVSVWKISSKTIKVLGHGLAKRTKKERRPLLHGWVTFSFFHLVVIAEASTSKGSQHHMLYLCKLIITKIFYKNLKLITETVILLKTFLSYTADSVSARAGPVDGAS